MLIDNEQAYPIYKFEVKFIEDGDHEKYKEYQRWIDGLPEGRIHNSTSTSFPKIFK